MGDPKDTGGTTSSYTSKPNPEDDTGNRSSQPLKRSTSSSGSTTGPNKRQKTGTDTSPKENQHRFPKTTNQSSKNKTMIEVFEDLKQKSFSNSKERMLYCTKIVDQLALRPDQVEETEEFANALEEFLDSFGYFPRAIRDSYRSWLNENISEDPNELAGSESDESEPEENEPDKAELDESVLSLSQQNFFAEQEEEHRDNPVTLASLEQFKTRLIRLEMRTKKRVAKAEKRAEKRAAREARKNAIIASIRQAIDRMKDTVVEVSNVLHSLGCFGQDIETDLSEADSDEDACGAFLNFYQPSQTLAGERPKITKCTDYCFLSRHGGWTVEDFNKLRTEGLSEDEITQSEMNNLRSVARLFDTWLANANVSKKSGEELWLKMKESQEFLASESATKFLNFKAANPDKEVVAKKSNGKELLYGTVEMLGAEEGHRENDQKWAISYTNGVNEECNLQELDELRGNMVECPPVVDTELCGSHAVMKWLLNQISEIGEKHFPRNSTKEEKRSNPPSGYSPSKKAMHNMAIPQATKRKKRNIDVLASMPGQFHILMDNSYPVLPVQVKSLLRKNQKQYPLTKEPTDQIFSHLSKYCMAGLNHYNVGVSSFATGVISTLAFIRVVQLHLIIEDADGNGEGMIKLVYSSSDRLPLISKDAFEKWARKQNVEEKLDLLKRNLYKMDGDRGYNGDIPPGILALYELTRRPRDYFFGPKYKDCFKLPKTPGLKFVNVIDHGNSCVVLAVERKQNKKEKPGEYAMKTRVLCLEKQLQNEIDILNHLCQNRKSKSPNEFLPILEEDLKLDLQLGSFKTNTTALLLSPKGRPLLSHLATELPKKEFVLEDFAYLVWDHSRKAMLHFHGHNVVHNDISPNNMIVVQEGEGIKICIVDFGCASRIGERKDTFIGTPHYMHKDLLFDFVDGGVSKPSHDNFSLALTCCAILIEGKPDWKMSGFWIPKTKKEVLETRRSRTTEIVQDCDSKQKLDDMLSWLKTEILKEY